MSARRRGRSPRPWIIAAAVLVLLAIAARSAALLGLVALGGIVAAVAWYAERRARPVARPATRPLPTPYSPPPTAPGMRPARPDLERQLADARAQAATLEQRLAEREAAAAAYVADLEHLLADTQAELRAERARLAEARASAQAAWDAAADRPPPPRSRPEADARSALIAAPLSGAHSLGGPS